LSNTTTLDALQKAYEIAKQQEETAARNVENLKAGNTTQADQANYSVQSAQNQLESVKTRINGQVSSASSQVELAQIQYQNALLALQNVSDSHRAIAPINGVVIKKSVSNGDTISQGQTLAIVGTPDQLKISFFIDQESLGMISPGLEVRIMATDGTAASGTVVGISPQADMATRRYEVEIRPILTDGTRFSLGSIVDIAVPLRKVAAQGNILVPISAVDVTPNGTFLMVMRDGKAVRIEVELKRILGEMVEVQAPVTPETEIILDGNRLASDGSPVTVIQ
jgi:HlyD family secretion protein